MVYKVSTKFLKATFFPVLTISMGVSAAFIWRAGWSAGVVPAALTFLFLWIMWGYLTAHIEINEQGIIGQSNELERRRIPVQKKFRLGFAFPWPHASTRQ